jgi:hypothetical protein
MNALLNHDPDLIALADASSADLSRGGRIALRGRLIVPESTARISVGARVPALCAPGESIRRRLIRGIASITAVRTLCPSCRKGFTVSPSDAGLPSETLYRSRGAPIAAIPGTA